jgi:hypothetical protein
MGRVRAIVVSVEKAISITYSEYVFVVLGIQNVVRMRHIVIVACPAIQYFSALSHKRKDFRGKKITERKMYVIILCTTSV